MSTPSTEAPAVPADLVRIFGGPAVTMLARTDEILLGDVVDTLHGPVHVREIVQRSNHRWDLAGDPPGHITRPADQHSLWPGKAAPLLRRTLPVYEKIRIRRSIRHFGRLKGHAQDVRSHNPVKRGMYTRVDGYTAACSCGWKATVIYASKGKASEAWLGHKAGQFSEAAYAENSALLWVDSAEVVHPHLPPVPWTFKKIVSGPRHGQGIAEASLDTLTVDQARQVMAAWQPVLDTDGRETFEEYFPGRDSTPRGPRPGHTRLRLSGDGGGNARVILTASIDGPPAGSEEQQDLRPTVKPTSARYAEELRRTPGKASADGHAGWACSAGASLLVRAETYGPGRLGTHHGVIYVCTEHQAAAEERIGGADYEPRVDPAPAGHRWDPWPCGHVTAYNPAALDALSKSVDPDGDRDPASLHPEPDEPDWDSPHFDGNNTEDGYAGEGLTASLGAEDYPADYDAHPDHEDAEG
ncbi:hypothetical protein [Streptomyces scabiei]|uniref:Uncharacterized protein n=1 Tax=Streptomyces scabiei TaxID=1930 RepID=A0A100JR09_STRSC|nr:hypothetical protein [Streptomyces scabiei]GAQ64099.1 hypothetical protein SsS58_04489 [Streptomyces scabiei]